MDNAPKEIELKLRVDPAGIAAIRSHPSLARTLRDPIKEMLVSVYFDTDDMLLRDHGLTLCVRHVGTQHFQTVKSAPRGGISEHAEWDKPIDGDKPDLTGVIDTGFGPILNDAVRDALKPVFETQVERTSYHLNGSDADLAIAFDEAQIIATDSSCPVSEIELELKHGNPAELFKLARAIGDIVPAWLDVKSKSERGYDLLRGKTAVAEKAHDPELHAEMSAGQAFTLICRACLRQLLANEPALTQRNAEALHQMRIALRRLRAAISLFSDAVSDERSETIKAELRWFGAELAPARDLDSFLTEALRPLRARQADEPGFASISRMFARERLKAYRRAQAAIQSDRFRAMALNTAEWIEVGPWNTSDDPLASARRTMSIQTLAAEQLSQRRKKIRRRGGKIDELNPHKMHKLRIQIKKARYATEFFSGLYLRKKAAKRIEEFRSSLKQLQNCLGGFNDIMTRKALCADVLERPGRSLTEEQNRHRAFAAGLIIGDQQAQIQALLDRARKAHSRFDEAKPFWK